MYKDIKDIYKKLKTFMDTKKTSNKYSMNSIQSIFLTLDEVPEKSASKMLDLSKVDDLEQGFQKKLSQDDSCSSLASSTSSEYVSYPLCNDWVLWHHSPFNKKWSISSYDHLFVIKTVEDFWSLYTEWESVLPSVKDSMFFVMKKGVKPIWEDTKNRDGGCWSLRIDKANVETTWLELSMALVGNYLTKRSVDNEVVTGLSISPKKAFSIIKIWCSENTSHVLDFISNSIPNIDTSSALFKIHKDSISADKVKQSRYNRTNIGKRR